MTKHVKRLYEFGPFRLDVTERLLLRDGKEIGLTPKSYEVLLVLIENNGHIVEREVLMEKCWPDSFVEDSNITQIISVLRQKLSDGGDNHEYIETIPRRGYRFTAAVKAIVEEVENSTPRNKVQYVLVISATINDIDKPVAEAIEAHLRKLSKDVTLTLMRIEAGSVVLILEGTRDGFERLDELIKSGELSEILGFDIEELRWGLISEKARIEPRHRAQAYSEDSAPRKETRFPTQSALALKQPAFDSLELLFGVDREQAAIRYVKIRQKLLKFFEIRGAEHVEDLADETIDRVFRKIAQVEYISNLELFFYGVARNVLKEHYRGHPLSPALQMPGLGKAEDDKRKLDYLEKCLLSLPDDEREMLITYYEGASKSKIVNRKNLAAQLGIPINSLRVRVMRIRAKLEKCISDCIEHADQDIQKNK